MALAASADILVDDAGDGSPLPNTRACQTGSSRSGREDDEGMGDSLTVAQEEAAAAAVGSKHDFKPGMSVRFNVTEDKR